MCLPNRSLGKLSDDVADISVEPIPLLKERSGCRLQTRSIGRKRCKREFGGVSPERTSWMRVEANN